MEFEHIEGEDRGKIVIYALSTCGWCKKTRELLDELGVTYDYAYLDHLEGDEKETAKDEVKEWNPKCSFPTLVFGGEKCIVGFKEDEIREAIRA